MVVSTSGQSVVPIRAISITKQLILKDVKGSDKVTDILSELKQIFGTDELRFVWVKPTVEKCTDDRLWNDSVCLNNISETITVDSFLAQHPHLNPTSVGKTACVIYAEIGGNTMGSLGTSMVNMEESKQEAATFSFDTCLASPGSSLAAVAGTSSSAASSSSTGLFSCSAAPSNSSGDASSPLEIRSVYVGLINQAMTCYLNSLLQTLFMTPEFRNALYNWDYTGGKEEQHKSIPYQLQKLFVLLQTSVGTKTALETKDLTRSFGWDSSHAWDQHDVQELCRVMFDALEVKWRRTSQATVINALYQGNLKDYVKCLECSTESARTDVFLDMPLAVKPFGSNQAYGSIEDALRGFVQPEVLDGSNQYSCEKCQKKCNAHKGLKITKFPYLLTIQLKRFDFDYTTMHRIKLNDRMTFPDLLNLNPFVETQQQDAVASGEKSQTPPPADKRDENSENKTSIKHGEAKLIDFSTPPKDESQKARADDGAVGDQQREGDSDDEGICVDGGSNIGAVGLGTSSPCSPADAVAEDDSDSYVPHDPTLVNSNVDRNLLQSYLKEGPYVYELFSIMVHAGSANGGHYYAYIKNLDTKVWYCFNDQVVNRASIEDIRKTYGGASSTPFIYSYSSSTNAYMLMYRQVDMDRNAKFPSDSKLPEHIIRMIDKLRIEEEDQRRSEERQRSLMTVRVYFFHPKDGTLMERELEVAKRETVSKVTASAHDAFDLGNLFKIPVELCRLVRFSKHTELLENSLEPNHAIHQELPWSYNTPELLLETAPYPGWFRPYTATNGLTLKIYVVDVAAGVVRQPKYLVYASKHETVEQLKHRFGELIKCDPNSIRFVLDHYTRSLRVLDVPDKKLYDEEIYRQGTLFADCCGDADSFTTPEEFEKTPFFAILDQYKHTVTVRVTLPSEQEYSAVGLESAYKVAHQIPQLVHDGGDVHMRSAEGTPSPTVTPGGGGGSANRLNFSAGQEECSTTSGSTQYVTPATSRSPSPPLYADDGTPLADASMGSPHQPLLDVSEMDASASGNVTPSPQVSPNLSPSAGLSPDCCVPQNQWESDLGNRDGFCWLNKGDDCATPEEAVDAAATSSGCDAEAVNEKSKDAPEKKNYYFEVASVEKPTSIVNAPVLIVRADKRMLVTDFIEKLSPHVGVGSDQFKVNRSTGNAEYQFSYSLNTTLDSVSSSQLRVKLGRPLKEGEMTVKFLRFELNDLEAFGKHLFEMALMATSKGVDIRRECQTMLKRQCGLDVALEKIRIRDCGSGFVDVLRNNEMLEHRVPYWSNDLHIQILEEPETVNDSRNTVLFLRRWCPSTLSLGPMQEIIVPDSCTKVDFFKEVSRMVNIPLTRLQCSLSKTEGTYPYECGKLKMLEETKFSGLSDEELEECGVVPVPESSAREVSNDDAQATGSLHKKHRDGLPTYDEKPLSVTNDGVLIYYRDSHEQPKALNDDERKELQIRDNARLRKNQSAYSWRKERALKIYTEISSSLADDLD